MWWLMPSLAILVIFCREVNAESHTANLALYSSDHLMAVACESSTSSISLCKQNGLTRSITPTFASHELPDGVVLDLCLKVADSESLTSSRSCKYTELEVLMLERKLIGNGAHRHLNTLLMARLEKFEECHVVIVERLPAGVFADMFELQRLVSRAVYNGAAIYGDHNLEQTASESSESVMLVYVKLKKEAQHMLQAQFSVPLHARYPAPNAERYVAIEIKFPILLFQCSRSNESASDSAVDDASRQMPWLIITTKNRSAVDSTDLEWLVAAGDPQKADTVAFLTSLASIIGVVALWMVSTFSHKRKVT